MSAVEPLQVNWLGHATVVLDLAGVRLVTDPLVGRHNGPLRRRGPTPRRADWTGAHAVLLSHLHHDHAEVASLRAIGAPVHTDAANAVWARRKGLSVVELPQVEGPGAPDRSGGAGHAWVEVGPPGSGVEVRQVPADHEDRPLPHRPNAAHGHLIRSATRRVLVVGDSDLTPEMSQMADWAGGPLDLVVVPIAGWGPKLSEGHLNPLRAAQACARIGARWALPYHSGTLHPPLIHRFGGWLDRPHREFAEALAPVPGTRLAPISGVPLVSWSVP